MKGKIIAHLLAMTLAFAGTAYPSGHYTHPHPRPEAVQPHDISIPSEFWNRLDFNFLMELEGFTAESDGVGESDITLATVELTVDADVADGVAAHLGLLWEEDVAEENILDVGYLTFGATDSIPFYLTAGKMYLPFGNFESVFISDPLTLELAEIRKSAALVGYVNSWVDVDVGAFNGDFEVDTDDNTINDAFASVVFTPCEGIVFGAYWVSDMLEGNGFEDFVNSAIGTGYAYEATGGAGAFLNARIGPVSLNAEYVTAIEKIDLPGGGLRPMAFNLEASMPVHEKVAVGVKVEGSNDFFADFGSDKWADEQFGFVVSYAPNDYVTLSGEYLHAEGLDDGSSADQATVQIALVL